MRFYCNGRKEPRGRQGLPVQSSDNSETWKLPLRQFPYPDVAETDGFALITVGLQLDWCAIVLPVKGLAYKERLSDQLEVILYQHSVEEHGDVGGRFQ